MKFNQTVDFPMTLIIKNCSKNSRVKKKIQSTPLVHTLQEGCFLYNIGIFCNAVFSPSLRKKFPLQRGQQNRRREKEKKKKKEREQHLLNITSITLLTTEVY